MAIETCPDDSSWAKLVAGELADDLRGAVLAHLPTCADCRALAAALPENDRTPAHALGQVAQGFPERYELRTEIVRGGMGRIYRAWDRTLAREVAIKCPREAGAARFAREIEILTSLSHTAIVPVLDAGQFSADLPYLVMPLLVGQSLAAHLAQSLTLEARIALTQTLLPLAGALSYAHKRGVLHRDVKPHNVFVLATGGVVLLDWGLATRSQLSSQRTTVAPSERAEGTGVSVAASHPIATPPASAEVQATSGAGTPEYASPEQLQGGRLDARVDIYGFGAMLYHVLVGTPPGTTPAAVERVAPEVPRDLAAIIARALAPDPEARYIDAEAMAADLARYFAGVLVQAREYSRVEKLGRFLARHRALVTVTGVGLMLAASGLAAHTYTLAHERDGAQRARLAAEAEAKYSQSIMTFVLDEVRHKFDSLGRLDLMRELAGQVKRLMRQAPQNPLDKPSTGAVQLELMIGDIALFEGRLGEAQQHFTKARTIAAAMAGPGTTREQVEATARLRCQALTRLATTLGRQQQRELARNTIGECLALLGTANAQTSPTIFELWIEAASVDAGFIVDDTEAAKRFEQLSEALGSTPTALALPQARRMHLRSTLASKAFERRIRTGTHTAAIAQLASRLREMEAWYAAAPKDANARFALALALQQLAAAYLDKDTSQYRQAILTHVATGDRLLRKALTLDPANAELLALHSATLTAWARATTSPEEELRLMHTALTISEQLAALAPDAHHMDESLAVDRINLVVAYMNNHQAVAALATCESATANLPSTLRLEVAVRTLLNCVEVATAAKRPQRATDWTTEALTRVRRAPMQTALDTQLRVEALTAAALAQNGVGLDELASATDALAAVADTAYAKEVVATARTLLTRRRGTQK